MNIWTNGCFDIVHMGHIELFKYASSLGRLYVGIDSDQRVKLLKGLGRPINEQNQRSQLLSSIKYIHKVDIFDDEKTLRSLLVDYNIDTIVVGDDYINKQVVGSDLVNNVLFFPKIPNLSTSSILDERNRI